MTDPTQRSRSMRLTRLLVRLGVIIVAALALHFAVNWLGEEVKHVDSGGKKVMFTGMLLLILLSYAFVIAIPFVPGVEIGLTLMAMQGAKIAPLVFLFTLIGLSLAFLAGHLLPYPLLSRFLETWGLRRTAQMVQDIAPLDLEQRTSLMKSRLPMVLGPLFVNWRYVFLAILINIPGNMVLGGGGGICFSAGLSRLFRPVWALLTLALAVAPVPAAFYFLGITLF